MTQGDDNKTRARFGFGPPVAYIPVMPSLADFQRDPARAWPCGGIIQG